MEEGIYRFVPQTPYQGNIVPTHVALCRGIETNTTLYQFLIRPNGFYMHSRPPTGGIINTPIEELESHDFLLSQIARKMFAKLKKVGTLDQIKNEFVFQEELNTA